jgi:hypothetical protein
MGAVLSRRCGELDVGVDGVRGHDRAAGRGGRHIVLRQPKVDVRQLRAALGRAAGGLATVAILFGAVSSADQVDEAESLMKRTAEDCRKSGTHPVECFTGTARLDWKMCRLVTELAIVQQNSDPHRRCVAAAKAVAATQFEAARRALANNKTGTDLLKDVYAYWLASLDNMLPKFEERNIAYRRRVAEEEQTLEHKLNRLNLEK